ncbi:MAG: TRAP transporter large permease [Enterococcus sp.]
MASVLFAAAILFIIFFILLFLRVPIAIAIATASVVCVSVLLAPDFGIFVGAQRMVASINSFTLLAVPFFILSGLLMNSGGIAQRLIDFSEAIMGKVPGSLAVTNILGNAMFGSISGSGTAAASAMGGTLGPIQKENGYDEAFSAAVNVTSAPVGQLIPPTAAFIVYSLAAGSVSVSALFLAGWIPGLLWTLAVAVVAIVISKKRGYKNVKPKIGFKNYLKLLAITFWRALPSLLLIFIIVGGIVAGIFTATEAAAVALLYTLFLSVVCYRTIGLQELRVVFGEAAVLSATIMFLIGASGVMGFVMTFTGIPEAISNAVMGVSDSTIVIFLLMNLILLVVGTFMDMAPAILIFTPIFLPIATNLGMDPIQFGVIIVFNLALGTITPPVGTVLFIGSNVGRVSVERIIKEAIPFYLVIVFTMMLVTFIPALSMWLPTLLGQVQ